MRAFLLFIALFWTTGCAEQDLNNLSEITFHYCYDGDTCTISIPNVPKVFGDHISVRLSGIDTPEIKGKCEQERLKAKEAKEFINDILSNAEHFELKQVTRGKYFRLVAEIWADGKNVNQMMLQQKLAIPYDGGTKDHDWCEAPSSKHWLQLVWEWGVKAIQYSWNFVKNLIF